METPTPEQVKGIFKDTYIFFQRYSNMRSDIEAQMMMREYTELCKKYPFKLCDIMLFEMNNIITAYENQRREL